jgi:UDP-glucuronate 4-epimerase
MTKFTTSTRYVVATSHGHGHSTRTARTSTTAGTHTVMNQMGRKVILLVTMGCCALFLQVQMFHRQQTAAAVSLLLPPPTDNDNQVVGGAPAATQDVKKGCVDVEAYQEEEHPFLVGIPATSKSTTGLLSLSLDEHHQHQQQNTIDGTKLRSPQHAHLRSVDVEELTDDYIIAAGTGDENGKETSTTPTPPLISAITKPTINKQKQKNVLVTGAAGFVGMHASLKLHSMGHNVVALDRDMAVASVLSKSTSKRDIHDFVKYTRLQKLKNAAARRSRSSTHTSSAQDDHSSSDSSSSHSHSSQLHLLQGNVCDRELLNQTITKYNIDMVLHLAATDEEVVAVSAQGRDDDSRPGRPFDYPLNNQDCFVDLLEVIKHHQHQYQSTSSHNKTRQSSQSQSIKLLYASSSKTFGTSYNVPWSSPASDEVLSPALSELTLFDGDDECYVNATSPQRTRRHNEMTARAYWSLYNVSSVGLRFTTLYGPHGRTDMRHFILAHQVSQQEPVTLYDVADADADASHSHGRIPQSIMYIDDAVSDIIRLMEAHDDDSEQDSDSQSLSMSAFATKNGRNKATVAIVDTNCPVSERDLVEAIRGALVLTQQTQLSSQDANSTVDVEQEVVPLPAVHWNSDILLNLTRYSYIGWNKDAPRCREHHGDGDGDDAAAATDVLTLEQGMAKYMDWFQTLPSWAVDAAVVDIMFSQMVSQEWTKDKDSETQKSKHHERVFVQPPQASDLCFVTSMFATNASHSDAIRSIESYNHEAPFKFYFFTNLEDMPCPGWERVVIPDFPFRRIVTQSRYPKFMGWRHPKLQTCRAILYSDALIPPHDVSVKTWELLTNQARNTKSGLFQRRSVIANKYNMTILQELDRIVYRDKDIAPNVEASKAWLQAQPDFNNEAPGYYNMFLVYNPWNEHWRELSTTFWTHYSNEEQSWRDQPLWRYMTYKLNIRPKTISTGKFAKFKRWYSVLWGKTHTKDHTYTADADHNSLALST